MLVKIVLHIYAFDATVGASVRTSRSLEGRRHSVGTTVALE